MNPKIRVGMIGCGRVAERFYLPALDAFGDIEVVAAVDPIEERRRLASGRFRGCVPYAALDEALIDRLDTALIASPPGSHIPLAAACLKRDRSVLVEKPMAPSMDGIPELRRAASASKGSLMMGFNYRFWEPAVKLRDLFARETGIDSLEMVFTSDYSLWDPVSFVSDPLDDLGPHVFDLIRYVFDAEIRSLTAVLRGENRLDLDVRMPGNVRVHCQIAHSGETKRMIRAAGRFHVNHQSVRLRPGPGAVRNVLDLADRIRMKLLGRTFPVKKSFELQLGYFFDAVRSGSPAVPGLEDGISAIRAVEAARTSLRNNGREILIAEST